MSRAEDARENFLKGNSCAQSVLLAFFDLYPMIPTESLRHIAAPFGAGMGRMRLTCGCVSGMMMAFGLIVGNHLTKNQLYAAVQELARRFSEKNGSVICGDLLRGRGVEVDTRPQAEERTETYYKKRPCPELCREAAEILEGYLIENGYLS